MVPVITMLTIALALGFAALLLVERQTSSARAERGTDAAQTLAEGVLTATASTLAGDAGSAIWETPFPVGGDGTIRCTDITGDLRENPQAGTPAETAIRTAVVRHFKASGDGLSEYVEKGGRRTVWRVELCPTADDGTAVDQRWEDAYRRRDPSGDAQSVITGRIGNQNTMWVRSQAEVRSTPSEEPVGSGTRMQQSRAVAAKVQQDGARFSPPEAYAIGTGNFSTDLGNQVGALVQNITNSDLLLDGLVGKVLGTNGSQLVEDADAKVGIRCGVLNGLEEATSDILDLQGPPIDLNTLDLNLCLGGVFSGLNGIGQETGLNALLGPLGITNDRYTNLNGMTMAPAPAIDAYRATAKAGGVHRDSVPGGWSVNTEQRSATRPTNASIPECDVPWNQFVGAAGAQRVLFIEQVGNDGEAYCRIPASRTGVNAVSAKAIVVDRGGLIIEGQVNSVVYALNGAECATAGEEHGCNGNHRRQQDRREVVRVEGAGQINGSVWTDGAKSEVGLYPAEPSSGAFSGALGPLMDGITRSTDNLLCSVVDGSPILGAVLDPVLQLLDFLIVDVVVGILYKRETMIVPSGAPAPGYFDKPSPSKRRQLGCAIVGNTIKALTPTALLGLLGQGGDTPPLGMDQYQRDCVLLTLVCGAWTKTTRTEDAITIPAGVLDQLLGNVTGLATNLLNDVAALFQNRPPMVQHNVDVINNAWVSVPENAALVPGTYRNVPPAAALPN
ncbi:MAG: hypothetical protein M0P31_06750 [Solirubrobacteraceae bacterium]|nr:hypothetical protein [Solirubrobacteraceae bacterium]